MDVEVKFNNPNEEFTLGIYCQAGEGYPIDEETGEAIFTEEPTEVTRLIIGFLIFSIIFYW